MMATQAWSARSVVFPVEHDPTPRAGWPVVQEPSQRISRLVDAMRSHVEDAWEAGNVAAAIRRAQRYQRLLELEPVIQAAYPPLTAHGPLPLYNVTSGVLNDPLGLFWRKVQWQIAEGMNVEMQRIFHGTTL